MRFVIRRAPALAVAFAIAVFAAACADSRDAGVIAGPGTRAKVTAADLGTEIDALIQQFYAGGARASVAARWQNVQRQSMRNHSGRNQHVRLVEWIQENTPSISPAPGEDQAHAAARLVLLMSLYVYGGPQADVPTITPTTDATLEIVQPTQTDTAKTPSEQAAVIFPEGAVSEPTVVVIRRIEEHFEEACSGPLPTTRCQYPQFYKFDVFPDVPLNSPATVAVCHVNTGTNRTPLADHERFRIAHEAPPPGAGRHPDGVIEEGIEILPLVTVGTLVECEDNEYPTTAMVSPDAGPLATLAARARWGVGYVAHAVGRVLTPKSLYAIDRGGGGELFLFSTFGTVDPQSRPDVTPGAAFSVSSSTLQAGSDVTIDPWNIANAGTAAAVQVGGDIILATDSALTDGAVVLGPLTAVNAVPPGHLEAVVARTVTIPTSVASGNYFLGVRLAHGGVHAESDETNNYVSVGVTVGRADPTSLFCPDGPSGSYSDLREAIVNTVAGGTVYVCDGVHDVDTVLVDKPLTLTAQNPGGNAWLGDVDQSAQGTQGGRPAIIIDGFTQGTVRVVDLGFRMKGRAVQVGRPMRFLDEPPTNNVEFPGRWSRVEIDNARFLGRNSDFGIGVQVWQHGTGVGVIEISNSHFDALGIGVFVTSHSEANVRNSTFENFTAGSVTYSGSTGGIPDPSLHRLAFGTVEDNVIRNCGAGGCMRMVLMANGTIARNRIEAGPEGTKAFGILVTRPPSTPHPRQPITIEDNEIIGASAGGDWAVGTGIQFNDAPGVTNLVRRNEIMSVNAGIAFNTSVNATDNKISGGNFGFHRGGNPALVIAANRNDVVGVATSFTMANNLSADYRCNWWGSVNGPSNPPQTGQFAPWAMAPIAGAATPCDPNVSLQTVRACQSTPLGGSPWNAGTVALAYTAVNDGGTVEICDGTHTVQNLDIRKSVTFAGTGSGMPTLDAEGSTSIFRSFNSPVNIGVRRLRLLGATEHAIHVNGINSLTVKYSEFHPFETHAYNPSRETYQENWMSGIGAFGDIGTVTVDSTAFIGGDIGVHANVGCCTAAGVGSGTLVVRNSHFTGQTNAGVFTGGGSPEYRLHVENSTFAQCGRMGCTKLFANNGGRAEYVNNTFTVNATRPVFNPINIGLNPGGTALIANNAITGTGAGGEDRWQPSSYPIDGPAIQFAGVTAEISGNNISNAFAAMNMSPGSLTGQDNVVSRVAFVLTGGPPSSSTVVWRRNDVTDFMAILPGTGAFGSIDMKCNWWGSTEGPSNPGFGVPASVYTPWAMSPIANTSTVCSTDPS